MLLREQLRVLPLDLALVFQIHFVAYKGEDELLELAVLLDLLKPLLEPLKAVQVTNVINKQNTLNAPVVLRGQSPVLLLARRVPHYVNTALRYSRIFFPPTCFIIFFTSIPIVSRPLEAKVWLVYRLTKLLLPTEDSPSSNSFMV